MLFRPVLARALPAPLPVPFGILAFRNIDEAGFRRTILVLLLVPGASLASARFCDP